MATKSEYQRLQSNRSELQREKATLASGDWDARDLSRFGNSTKALTEAVEEAVGRGRFKKRPVGPVGRHVRLAGEAADGGNDLADLLEAELGFRNLNTFLVDNLPDYSVLDSLIKDIFPRQRPPQVRQWWLTGWRHDHL